MPVELPLHTKNICHICGAGEARLDDLTLRQGDLLIAADGGLDHLRHAGLVPHVFIGDMDSVLTSEQAITTIRLPVRKDDTDMAAAVAYGEKQGYTLFHLYGATGGRSDHTYANYQLLAGMSLRGVRGVILDGAARVTAITDGALVLPDAAEGTVSVFAVGGRATGVSLQGLSYPLCDAVLTPFVPLGVSNEVASHPAVITVKKGTLLIMWQEIQKPLDK